MNYNNQDTSKASSSQQKLRADSDCSVSLSSSYVYNRQEPNYEWREATGISTTVSEFTEMNNSFNNADNQFRVSHLNVLLPAFGLLLKPEVRYKHQLSELLPNLLSDVYCFNEASSQYLNMMKGTDWVKKECFLSHISASPNKTHEVMICAKRPFRSYRFRGTGSIDHRCLGALFQLDNKTYVLVVAAHLSAYENNITQREKEFELINNAVSSMPEFEFDLEWKEILKETITSKNIILCGDLNLHAPCETRLIYDSGYLDTWLQSRVRKGGDGGGEVEDEGFTWDPYRNSMINLMLLFDNRRMRLDRVLLKRKSISLRIRHVNIFGDNPISFHSGGGVPTYLYPSDHFGLVADFQVKRFQEYWQQHEEEEEEEEEYLPHFSNQATTGYRSISTIIAMRVVGVLGIGLALGAALVF